MHYFQRNIGDYRRDTSHLSLLEHGVYQQLLDTYYLSEAPLTLDHAELMRTHCARNADEVRAVENVLKDFFDATENGYVHKRCEEEITKFYVKSSSARASAKARWAKVSCERITNALPTQCEGNATQQPNNPTTQQPNIKTTPLARSEKTKPSLHAVQFDFSSGAFSNINGQMGIWAKAYPAVNLQLEINRAAAWLVANPTNRKSNYAKFLTNWFSRTQDKAPAKGGTQRGFVC